LYSQDIERNNRSKEGFWKAFSRTWTKIIFSPHNFFASIYTEKSLKEPLLFAISCSILAVLFGGLIGFLGRNFILCFTPQARFIFKFPILLGTYFIVVVATPLWVTFLAFSSAAFLHLMVLIFRGKGNFRATFGVIAYSNATSLFSVIPIAGTIFASLYRVVLIILGLKYVHKISMLKSVLITLLPMLLFSLLSLFFILEKFKKFI
jgi:hypothetical protein